MTKLSSVPMDSSRMGEFLNNFWTLLTLLQNKKQISDFLKEFFSHTEVLMFAKRLQVCKMLLEGYKYGDIKRYVKVTDQTVARINNIINKKTDGFIEAVSLLIKYEEKQQKDLEKTYQNPRVMLHSDYKLPRIIGEVVEDEIKTLRRKISARQRLSDAK